ncbi:MAG: hypothetical protein Q9160_004682 [Pyrenula sp. 1 TL-2023]
MTQLIFMAGLVDCPLTPNPPVNYPDFTPQAQRIVNYFASGAGNPQSEDCLTLNIWSKPSPESDRAEKPVLVFFYGGRFSIGNTNTPFYNGQYFADAEDLIVVTVNYRINIFGFPGAPGEIQNLGLRDQRIAVEWIRDNIANFGGSPNNIILSGQSAGGVSVDYWSYAYLEDPIASGLIEQSGNAFSFPLNAPTTRDRNWNTVVQAVNCTRSSDIIACMRSREWQDIKAAAGQIKGAPSSNVLRSIPPFYPTVDNELVFPDYNALLKSKKFADLTNPSQPLLLGSTNNEDGYYRVPAYANGIVPTESQVRSFLLESFTCPNAHVARNRLAAHHHQKNTPPSVWLYRYFGTWPNTRLFPTSGAYHGTDLHMTFGASADVSGLPTTEAQRQTTALMRRAWAAFCADPVNGLVERVGWPRFEPGGKSLVRVAVGDRPEVDFVEPGVDGGCANVTLGALAGVGAS